MSGTGVFASILLGAAWLVTGCGTEPGSDPTASNESPISRTSSGQAALQSWPIDSGWYALRAESTGRYVSANYGGYVIADRTAIGPWEKFFFTYLYNDSNFEWALVASNNQLVSADLTKGDRLVANRNGVGPWEEFYVADLGDPSCLHCWVALQARSTGQWVSADLTIGGVLIANRDSFRTWETFELWPVSPP